MQRSALCRSPRERSNEYLLAKLGVDTAENEPLKVRVIFQPWDVILTEPPRPRPARLGRRRIVLEQRRLLIASLGTDQIAVVVAANFGYSC